MNLDNRIEKLRAQGLAKRAKRTWYKKWWVILLLSLALLLLIYIFSFAFLLIRLKNNPSELERVFQYLNIENKEEGIESYDIRIVQGPSKYSIGSSEPKATIVLFSDFNCPYCKLASEIVGELALKYGEHVNIIVRDFPILSDDSLKMAMALRCAGEQGVYWPMYYYLFENQGQFSVQDLGYIAQLARVEDIPKFSNCIAEEKYLNMISKDFSDGEFLGVEGTPTWFLDGYKVTEGNFPLEIWSVVLEQYLIEKYETN